MSHDNFQPPDIEAPQEPIDPPTVEDVMFAIFEYARRSDGVDSTEGPARVRQRERMFAKDRELRAMLGDMQTHAYAEGRKDEREELTRLLGWAYGKLSRFSYSKQEDALMLDEINLILLGAP